jgi:hypothetical protein
MIASPGGAVDGIVRSAAVKLGFPPSAGTKNAVALAICLSFTINWASLMEVIMPIVTGSPGTGDSGITVYLIWAETILCPAQDVRIKQINSNVINRLIMTELL